MEQDAEAAGLASAGGLSNGVHHPVEKGAPCKNCGMRVEERFCTNCGQLGADFHRPIWDLVTSSIGDMWPQMPTGGFCTRGSNACQNGGVVKKWIGTSLATIAWNSA